MGSPRLLAIFAKLTVLLAMFVVFRGAMVTTHDAGMAVPDWPLSFGSFNPPGWWRDLPVRLEHSHRLVAALLSSFTAVLLLWVWLEPAAKQARAIATVAFGGVLLQALAGGLRVLFNQDDLQVATVFRIIHGCLAHAEVCLLVIVAALLSPAWQRWPGLPRLPRKLAWFTAGAIYLQIVFGAIIRHLGAGLAIPTFPAANAEGGFMPRQHGMLIDSNFTHTRVMASVVTLLVIALAWRTLAQARGEPRLVRPALGIVLLLGGQVALGILVIWHTRPMTITTLHVVNGTLLLSTTLLLALRLGRARVAGLNQ